MTTKRTNSKTRFKSKGVGVKHDTNPVSVMLPPEHEIYVRSRPSLSEWMREAVAEKIEREKG